MHKHMLRAFGLSLLAALGLMAFAAVGVQAETLTGTAGKILPETGTIPPGEKVLGEQEGAGTLLIPALNVEIVCQKVDVLDGLIINAASGEALGEVLYLECEYWSTKTVKHASGVELLELVAKLPCEILEDPNKAAKAIVAKARLLVVLHKKTKEGAEVEDTYVLVEPDKKEGEPEPPPLASVLVTTPSECPLPKLVNVTGSTVFQVTLGDLNLTKIYELYVLIKSNKEIAKLFSDELRFGVNTAYIDGSALLWLASDVKWGCI